MNNSVTAEIINQVEKVRALQRRDGRHSKTYDLKKEEEKLDKMLNEYQKMKQ
jgi:hypothetical protein